MLSSSAVNSDFSDIATALTGSVASNGVTTITGQLKSSITASPAYSSSVDLTTGWGVSASGTAAIYASGSIVGTATSAGITLSVPLTVNGSITASSFNFSGTGAIQIPAGTTAQRPATPVVGDIRFNINNFNYEGTPDGTRWDIMSQANTLITISASVASSLLTVSVLNGRTGAAATPADPVTLNFRDATLGAGDSGNVIVTSALSINTNGIGASLGSSNGVPFRFWLVAFNNAGSAVLGLINCSTPTQIFPLNETALQSSTPISNSATSAGVFYTPNGVTVSNAPIRILGYVEYANGLATAGTYLTVPTTIQLFSSGVKKPGDIVQMVQGTTSSSTGISGANTQTSLSASITPTSSINLILADADWMVNSGTTSGITQYFRMARTVGPTYFGTQQALTFSILGGGTLNLNLGGHLSGLDAPGTTSSVTYAVFGVNAGGSVFNGLTQPLTMRLQEIMG